MSIRKIDIVKNPDVSSDYRVFIEKLAELRKANEKEYVASDIQDQIQPIEAFDIAEKIIFKITNKLNRKGRLPEELFQMEIHWEPISEFGRNISEQLSRIMKLAENLGLTRKDLNEYFQKRYMDTPREPNVYDVCARYNTSGDVGVIKQVLNFCTKVNEFTHHQRCAIKQKAKVSLDMISLLMKALSEDRIEDITRKVETKSYGGGEVQKGVRGLINEVISHGDEVYSADLVEFAQHVKEYNMIGRMAASVKVVR